MEYLNLDTLNLKLASVWPYLTPPPQFQNHHAIDKQKMGKSHLRYEQWVVCEKTIPTRLNNPHDHFNALVWIQFPMSKWNLHHRQYQILERLAEKGNRTQEQDALTILDEGGVIRHHNETHLFGHALLEHLELRPTEPLWGMLVETDPKIGSLDAALSAMILDPKKFLNPQDLHRHQLI